MNYNFLANTVLFRGVTAEEAENMLACLKARREAFSRGAVICRAGDTVQSMGLVLSGSVNIENDDVWGNKSIIENIGAGEVFAETYACLPEEPMLVNVVAAEETEVLFLNTDRLLKTCPESCVHHEKLIRNLLSASAQKNLILSRRIFHTASKTIRGRLLSYLSFQAVLQGSCRFMIPFNRQQLADYLGVDRSALSNELGKMKREGLIEFHKNYFVIRNGEEFEQ